MEWTGKRTDTGDSVKVAVENGFIQSVEPVLVRNPDLPWLSPGWIDLQVNGIGGFDLNAEQVTREDVVRVTGILHSKGVAGYLPTVVSGDFERMRRGLAEIHNACLHDDAVRESVLGIHLEGPYFSAEDGPRGAHPVRHIRKPDWEEFLRFQEAAGGLIVMVTMAPETEGAIPFIERLAAQGIIVCIGHTMANDEQLNRAVLAGATVSTHLGNGAHPRLPRHPNYIWSQLADDRLWASFIPDGHHLAPAVLKTMVRAKRDKSLLVSDCVSFAGMPPGRYMSLIGYEVELREDGRLFTVGNPDILAGSAYTLDLGVANAVRYTDLNLDEAIQAVTCRPAQVLRNPQWGSLDIGSIASFTLFDHDESFHAIAIRETVVGGKTVYKRV